MQYWGNNCAARGKKVTLVINRQLLFCNKNSALKFFMVVVSQASWYAHLGISAMPKWA